MTTFQVVQISRIIDDVAAIRNYFTPESVSHACSTVLHEVECSNRYLREFQGYPDGGPFSKILLRRFGAESSETISLLVMLPSGDAQLTQTDLAIPFALSSSNSDINPHIPPEGAISFREVLGNRMLILQFMRHSLQLRLIAIHENP